MATPVKVVLDASELMDLGRAFRGTRAATAQATFRTINYGGRAGFAVVKPAVIKATGIKASRINASKGLRTKTANMRDPTFDVIARSPWTPLSYFSPTKTPEGVQASPWGVRRTFARTFMVTFSSGFTGVFRRDTTAGRKTYTSRSGRVYQAQPIIQLWGPSLAVEMERNQIPESFRKRATEAMAQRLPHELDFALGKIKPRAARKR